MDQNLIPFAERVRPRVVNAGTARPRYVAPARRGKALLWIFGLAVLLLLGAVVFLLATGERFDSVTCPACEGRGTGIDFGCPDVICKGCQGRGKVTEARAVELRTLIREQENAIAEKARVLKDAKEKEENKRKAEVEEYGRLFGEDLLYRTWTGTTTCTICGGKGMVAEEDGTLKVCPICNKRNPHHSIGALDETPKPPKGICPDCRGTGEATGEANAGECPRCGGSGCIEKPCPQCMGVGVVTSENGLMKCRACAGEGWVEETPAEHAAMEELIAERQKQQYSGPPLCTVCNGRGRVKQTVQACSGCGATEEEIWMRGEFMEIDPAKATLSASEGGWKHIHPDDSRHLFVKEEREVGCYACQGLGTSQR